MNGKVVRCSLAELNDICNHKGPESEEYRNLHR